MLSLVSWNVDGLARLLPHGLAAAHEALARPDVLCLQEVRIRPSDRAQIVAMTEAIPGYRCAFSLCDDPVNVRFRGGRAYGVATYVRADLATAEATHPAWDREGRLLMYPLPSLGWVTANVYAVNGTDKPYFDHERGGVHGDRHLFKRTFQAQLAALFADASAPLILAGDWNVSRTSIDTFPRLRREPPHALARAQLNEQVMPALDLVDVFREIHPSARRYTWFNRRTPKGRLDAARVDYVLMSRTLLQKVEAATILDEPDFRHGSDHAPVGLVLRT